MQILILILCTFLFCSSAKSEVQKKTDIFTCQVASVQPGNPESIKSGNHGSEENAILSQQLGQTQNKASEKKALICGVCRNVENNVQNTVLNIEELGTKFKDYAVIIYENNSTDNTVKKFNEWASRNKRVYFISENLTDDQMQVSRPEKIARARNLVLCAARDHKYSDFDFFIMADLDFKHPWPIKDIIETFDMQVEWDCVCANGVSLRGDYWDIYAFRDEVFPFGPELLGDEWWPRIRKTLVKLPERKSWIPVYSAFGGLAIYKTKSIINFSYSGTVTDDLKEHYKKLLVSLPKSKTDLQKYFQIIGVSIDSDQTEIPIIFRYNSFWDHPHDYEPVTCCEHVPLHAQMINNGLGKIFINPKMHMIYE